MDTDALFKLTHGIYILGADDNGRPVGCTVDAVMQVADKPTVIALSCRNTSYTKSVIEQSGRFSLSVLGQNADPFVVADFGFQSSRTVDKWQEVPHVTENGLPCLQNCLACFFCNVLSRQSFESNTLFVAEVVDGKNMAAGEPLTYFDYRTSFKEKVLKFLPNILNRKENKNG